VFAPNERYPNTIDDFPGTMTVHNITFHLESNQRLSISQVAGGSLAWLPQGNFEASGGVRGAFISMDIDLRINPSMGAFTHYITVPAGGYLELDGRITGSLFASLIKEGAGPAAFAPRPGVTGYLPTSIVAGVVYAAAGNPGAHFSSSFVSIASGAVLALAAPVQIDSLVGTGTVHHSLLYPSALLTTGSGNASATFGGVIEGNVSLVKVGTGTFTLSGHNTYTGTTTIAGGTLQLGVSNALPGSAQVNLTASGTRLDLNGFDTTINSLAGVAGSSVTLGSATLTLNRAAFSGAISGSGGKVTKNGSDVAAFAGNNSYSGLTSVNAGTLLIDGFQPISTVAVAYGATLSGYGTAGFLSVLGTIHPSGGHILNCGTAVFNGGSTFWVTLTGTTPGVNYDQLSSNSNINIGGNPTLHVSLDFNSAVGDQFVIMATSGSLSGTFTGLPEGQVFAIGQARFQIHYTANRVVLTHVANVATHFLIGAPATSQAGTAFDVTVTALDAGGHPDPLYTGTVHFTSQDPYGALLPLDYTFTAADQGQHTFPGGATLFTAGTWDVTASDTASGITGTVNVQVTPAPASILALTAPAGASSGSPFDVAVTAQDPYGNTDTNYQGTVTFSTSDTDPGVVLPADYTFQPADQGSVTFAGGVTLITPGDQTITTTDTINGFSGNATVTVTIGGMSPDGGGRSRILLPWTGAATERVPVISSPSATGVSTPADPRQPGVEMVDPEPFKAVLTSAALVRRAPTREPATPAIDLIFTGRQSWD
jgi:autotransporter-associated beta strand protein